MKERRIRRELYLSFAVVFFCLTGLCSSTIAPIAVNLLRKPDQFVTLRLPVGFCPDGELRRADFIVYPLKHISGMPIAEENCGILR